MKPIKAKACGKFILIGEHFVVPAAGQPPCPALAFPLHELRCEVTLHPETHPRYIARLPDNPDKTVIEALMARAAYAAADSMRVDISTQPFRIESTSNFPVSRGFGSSAAFAVALARAFDEYRANILGQKHAEQLEIQKTAQAIEKIFHGTPSGLDSAVILEGQPVRFKGGAIIRMLDNKTVDFILVDSGERENCAQLVERVSSFRKREPAQWSKMASAVSAMVDECEHALIEGRSAEVAKTVRESQGVLAELGLSNPAIDSILSEATKQGALSGKVSGAGGGGAVLIVAEKGDGKRVAQKLRDRGCTVITDQG